MLITMLITMLNVNLKYQISLFESTKNSVATQELYVSHSLLKISTLVEMKLL